jgi:hypothetical protein
MLISNLARINATISSGIVFTELTDTGTTLVTISDSNHADTASEFSVTVDWGDGTETAETVVQARGQFDVPIPGLFIVNGDHTYDDAGTFTLVANITGPGSIALSASGPLTVTDNISGYSEGFFLSADGTISGNVGTFTDIAYEGQSIANYSATIDWGDGTGVMPPSIGITQQGSSNVFNIDGSHTYTSNGLYLVTETVHETPEQNTTTLTQELTVVEPAGFGAPPASTSVNLIMRQGSNLEIYDIGNNAILAAGALGNIDPSWQIAGIGGFVGPNAGAMIVRNSTGEFVNAIVIGNGITDGFALGQVGPEWTVAGFADFSGAENESDMLMRNRSTGAFEIYDLNNIGFTGFHSLGQVGAEWSVSGFGDFSGTPGEADMLMRSNTGAFELYDISNNQYTGFFSLGQVGTEWQVAGFGDFSGNANETDMLMRDSSTGTFELYDISHNQYSGFYALGQVGPEWQVAGFADFSGNANETDMLMRNSSTGAFELYDISNNQLTSFHYMGQIGPEWTVAALLTGSPSSGGTAGAQMAQAIASLGSSSAGTGPSTSPPADDPTQQQSLLTTPQT